jgi:hypothetical protein
MLRDLPTSAFRNRIALPGQDGAIVSVRFSERTQERISEQSAR